MIETTARTFKDIQSEYDKLFQTEPIRDDDSGYRWHAAQVLKFRPGARRILDLACGGGFFMKQLRNMTGGKIALDGLDISPEALVLAQKECPEGQYAVGVGEALPYKNGTFDAITCLGSMEHFLDIPQAVAEMKRTSTPNARFFILVPNLFWYKDIFSVLFTGSRKTRNQTHERFAAMREWIETFEGQGLKVVKTVKYNGIARKGWKQALKDLLIPRTLSYHFMFVCEAKHG